MRELGGFLDLELNNRGSFYHDNALAFNSGSSALLFYLINSEAKTVYIPFYTCSSVVSTLKKTDKKIIFYTIDKHFSPNVNFDVFDDQNLLIYNDYFGLNQNNVKEVLDKASNVLIDASQAFYFYVPEGINLFNSVRKFFGVPDGGFLYSNKNSLLKDKYEELKSTPYSYQHLIDRIEYDADNSYQSFLQNEALLAKNGIGKISKLTKRLLQNIDFKEVKGQRQANFEVLNGTLGEINELKFLGLEIDDVPLCYPLLIQNGRKLKKYLINKKIYIPTFWPEIKQNFNSECFVENKLLENLVCLPLDQRYNRDDMNYIISKIQGYFDK